jgi:PAS domain S-box-containing protein
MADKLEKDKQIERLLSRVQPLSSAQPVEQLPGDVSAVGALRALEEQFDQQQQLLSFYKSVVQNISSGIITLDLQGNITFLNRKAARVLNYPQEALRERPFVSLAADEVESRNVMRQIVGERRPLQGQELRLRSGSGKIIRIGLSSMPLHDATNQHEGIIITFRDLTQVLAMREQMERVERLATLGELSSGIAHEIRNPLAGVKASAQVLQEALGDNDSYRELIERIVREIDRSNELLKEFFTFARPGKPHRALFAVDDLVSKAHRFIVNGLRKANITFQKRIAAPLPAVFIDAHQIERVLINLLSNALQAMPDGGNLLVTAEAESQGMVEIAVWDTGVGISSEIREKIFNPFFTTRSDGLGLGLSISNRLATENGGRLEVESQINKGTVFRLFLPTTDND